jgi:translation initiation factor IF-1
MSETSPAPSREVKARVLEALPKALFRVETLGPRHHELIVHSSAPDMLRVRPGDVVVVEPSPIDASRGRIVRRGEAL